MRFKYSIGEDGTPYLHTPNVPPHPLGPPGDLEQAQRRIRGHAQRHLTKSLDWRVDWPDRMVNRVKSGNEYVWRVVKIDPITGLRGRPVYVSSKEKALA